MRDKHTPPVASRLGGLTRIRDQEGLELLMQSMIDGASKKVCSTMPGKIFSEPSTNRIAPSNWVGNGPQRQAQGKLRQRRPTRCKAGTSSRAFHSIPPPDIHPIPFSTPFRDGTHLSHQSALSYASYANAIFANTCRCHPSDSYRARMHALPSPHLFQLKLPHEPRHELPSARKGGIPLFPSTIRGRPPHQ